MTGGCTHHARRAQRGLIHPVRRSPRAILVTRRTLFKLPPPAAPQAPSRPRKAPRHQIMRPLPALALCVALLPCCAGLIRARVLLQVGWTTVVWALPPNSNVWACVVAMVSRASLASAGPGDDVCPQTCAVDKKRSGAAGHAYYTGVYAHTQTHTTSSEYTAPKPQSLRGPTHCSSPLLSTCTTGCHSFNVNFNFNMRMADVI